MKTIIHIISLLALLPCCIYAQGGLVNNGAIMKVSNSTDLKIEGGGVTNQANGRIVNEGNIYLDLNWSQTGTTTNYTGGGWMWFEGGANQNLSSVSALTVPRLRVDNNNRLILGDNVTVSTRVDLMNNGSIELGNNNLVISPGGDIVNYDANNFIITNNTGILQQEVSTTDVVFPVGNASYNPATLNNSGTTDNFQVRVFNQVLNEGTTGAVKNTGVVGRTWMIDEVVTGGSNVDMTLQWQIPEELAFDRNNCGIARHTSGTLWDNPPVYGPATNVGTNTWTQTRTGFTTFSPFVVRDPTVDLPVELVTFEAVRQNRELVQLDWVTASETNNMGFEVERMLDTETEFKKIAWVDGQGSITEMFYYDLLDPNPHAGISYYRLKQIDFDGTVSYSVIRAVEGYETKGSLSVYPVPTYDRLNINFNDWITEDTDVTIQVMDVLGRVLIRKDITIQPNMVLTLEEVQALLPGTYFVNVSSPTGLNAMRKFIRGEE